MADVGPGEVIRQRAEACQKIVDEALENWIGVEDFLQKLREVSASPTEASDYGQQYTDRLDAGSLTPGTDSDALVHEATVEGLDEDQ